MAKLLALGAGLLGIAVGCTEPVPERLLLISVDTLRADQLGVYGSDRGLTPNLDALAARSVLFERSYAPAPFTLPSVASLMTGRHPIELGIQSNESGVPADVPTLAAALSANGWRTGAVVGNFVLRRESGIDRGFERFDDAFDTVESGRGWPERAAEESTGSALELIRQCDDLPRTGCFVWVHYQDPHGPYTPPDDVLAPILQAERGEGSPAPTLRPLDDHTGEGGIPDYQYLDGRLDAAGYRARYRAEIAHTDREIGRVLAAVAGTGTTIVFASDHGESLGERDVWFAHGSRLTDEQVRVPLLISGPGIAPGRRTDVAGLVDVLPTLLAHFGLAAAVDVGRGRDLLAPGAGAADSTLLLATLGGGPVLRLGLVADGYKLVTAHRSGVWDANLYRLGDEDADLAAAAPQEAARLRRRLEQLREGLPQRAEARVAIDEETRRRLDALGYGSEDPEEGPDAYQ